MLTGNVLKTVMTADAGRITLVITILTTDRLTTATVLI